MERRAYLINPEIGCACGTPESDLIRILSNIEGFSPKKIITKETRGCTHVTLFYEKNGASSSFYAYFDLFKETKTGKITGMWISLHRKDDPDIVQNIREIRIKYCNPDCAANSVEQKFREQEETRYLSGGFEDVN
jgi:hypothetical protein